MITEHRRITVGGIKIDVVRKDIKNLHLGVYPPSGRVRVAVPRAISNDAVRLAVIDKLGWIKRQVAAFRAQPRQSRREMVNGESHYFLGRRYRLRLHECHGRSEIAIRGIASLDMFVRPGTPAAQRRAILQRWHRQQLRTEIAPLLKKWQRILDVEISAWGIKRMKTKWGSCNPTAQRVWFNLELAKKPLPCIEYIVVHELAHMLERHHNARFVKLLDRHLPHWRHWREHLKIAPLGADTWR